MWVWTFEPTLIGRRDWKWRVNGLSLNEVGAYFLLNRALIDIVKIYDLNIYINR